MGPTIVPIYASNRQPGLGIGQIVVALEELRQEESGFRVAKIAPTRHRALEFIEASDGAPICLYSNFMWTLSEHLEISERSKQTRPDCFTIHGGPHTPHYEAQNEEFFEANPHVDCSIRQEGELTAQQVVKALTAAPRHEWPESIAGIAGVTVRVGDRVVRGPDPERISDLGSFGSPYLLGTFDHLDPAEWHQATLETNRGCPYGCTFCDWGQVTLSRIRKFPLEPDRR